MVLTTIVIVSAFFWLLPLLLRVTDAGGSRSVDRCNDQYPGLAAVDVSSPLISIERNVYPFGVIGVILFVRLYPKIPAPTSGRPKKNTKKKATWLLDIQPTRSTTRP